LAEGDLVAADADLTESAALLVDESSVTGESVPVERPSNLLIKQPTSTWRRALLSYGDGESTAATVTGANSTIAGWLRCSTDTSGARALEQGRAAARFGTIDPAHCRYVLITL
jgi:Ca2+-transporting ATPase